jgi:hypothetical protein
MRNSVMPWSYLLSNSHLIYLDSKPVVRYIYLPHGPLYEVGGVLKRECPPALMQADMQETRQYLANHLSGPFKSQRQPI